MIAGEGGPDRSSQQVPGRVPERSRRAVSLLGPTTSHPIIQAVTLVSYTPAYTGLQAGRERDRGGSRNPGLQRWFFGRGVSCGLRRNIVHNRNLRCRIGRQLHDSDRDRRRLRRSTRGGRRVGNRKEHCGQSQWGDRPLPGLEGLLLLERMLDGLHLGTMRIAPDVRSPGMLRPPRSVSLRPWRAPSGGACGWGLQT